MQLIRAGISGAERPCPSYKRLHPVEGSCPQPCQLLELQPWNAIHPYSDPPGSAGPVMLESGLPSCWATPVPRGGGPARRPAMARIDQDFEN